MRRMDRRRRWASRVARAKNRLGLLDGPVQTAIYKATFRSDEELLTYSYALTNDHLPDLHTPVWFNEKIRWQFLHHRNPLMSLAADKIAVRDYLKFKGARIEPPKLLATFDSLDEIAAFDFPRRYALKSSFGTGQNRLEDGTGTGERADIVLQAARWLKFDQWRNTGEFHYRDIRKRWLVEEFVPSKLKQVEYKVFCIMGRPVFILNITDREGPNTFQRRIYDCDWKPVGFQRIGDPPPPDLIPRPRELDAILAEAGRLSEDFLHVRVDFLQCDDRVVFSELTFASAAARVPFTPEHVNVEFGEMMDLDQAQEYLERGRIIASTLRWPVAWAERTAEPV